MASIFIIYKSWYDPMVGSREPDSGYDVVGFVQTEEEAEQIVSNGGEDIRAYTPQPMYKYEEVSEFNIVN